jgi:very-short-patch-repair endonuclease
MGADHELAALAARQYGLITVRDVRRAGMTRQGVRHRLRAGRWTVVRDGVFAIAGARPTWAQSVLAAVLAAGDTAAASHFTAATLWELELDTKHRQRLEITTAIERQIRLDGVVAHRTGILPEHDRTVHREIPVATMARTIMDLSAAVDQKRLSRLVDEALRRRLMTLTALHACASRLFAPAPGRRPKVVQALLAARVPGYDPGDSDLETRCWEALRDVGVPVPVRQHPVLIDGRRYWIDLAYPSEHIAIELDGFDFHRSRTSFDADRTRGNALVLAGWQLLRFTSRSTPAEMVEAIVAARSTFVRERAV